MGVKRSYDGSRRTAATQATKRHVVETARRLFLEAGYPATTVAQVADESGVPPATIYRHFGSKREILKAVLDVAFGGDDEDIEFQHRPEVQDAFAAQDAGAMLDAFAHVHRGVMKRAGALQHVLAASAVIDDEAAEMLEATRRQRHLGQGRIVRDLARRKALRAGLTQREAVDIVYTVMSPEIYRILTVERGWSDEQLEAWVAHTLRTQLLGIDADDHQVAAGIAR
jgi:AcrR family transcriptional regulator